MVDWKKYFRRPTMQAAQSMPPARRWPLYLGVFLAIWLSLYLYADTLGFPYFQEDSSHIIWLIDRTPLDPFLSAEGAPAYRPLGKSLIKVWHVILGHHDIPWLRFHNLVFNILNITLIGKLAVWLDRGRWRYVIGGLAALLFGTYPFAYQAIPWINNFFYPLENLLLLLMTAVYWQARIQESNKLLGLALFFCLLAPFEIEYGVMTGGLLFVIELVLWQQKRQAYPWLTGPLLGVVMNSLFVLRWVTVPKRSYFFGPPTLERMLLISAYFLQGLVYPLSPLARPLMNATGWPDYVAVVVVGVPVLLLLTGYLVKKRQWPVLLLGLGWFVLFNMPALVYLNIDYVASSPRILYPAGAGIVWLWAAGVVHFMMRKRWRVVRRGASVVFILLVLWLNVRFVRTMMEHYRLAEQPSYQLAEFAREFPSERPLLVVNFPSWIRPAQDFFAMGKHAAAILPYYIGIDALITALNESPQPARAVRFNNIRQPQAYIDGMLGEDVGYDELKSYLLSSGNVYLTQWGTEALDVVWAGRVTDVPTGEMKATFGEQITLLLIEAKEQDGRINLSLSWELLQPVPTDVTVFLHLYGTDGQLVTQLDGYPLYGLSPFWLWDSGQQLLDQRALHWENLPAGVYRVGIGLYDRNSGERLTAVDSNGNPVPDNAVTLLTVEIEEKH